MATTSHRAQGAVASVLALLLMAGCASGDDAIDETGTAEPSVSPSPSEPAEPTDPPDTDETSDEETDDPLAKLLAEPAPPLPDEVGEWVRDELTSSDTTVDYVNDTGDGWLTATHWEFLNRERALGSRVADPTEIGDWLCGTDPSREEYVQCATEVWNGAVNLMTRDLDMNETAAFGDELIEIWGETP